MAFAVRSVFSSSAEGPAVRIDRLRRALCTAETATGLAGEVGVPLTLGIPLIDGVLGGGLSGCALHEIAAARETEIAAATGFALALAARAALASEASGQRSHAIVRAHLASEDARERADDTRPEPGSSARAALASEASGQRSHSISARAGHSLEPGSSARSNAAAPYNSTPNSIAPKRDAIWIAEDLSLAENGAPYGPGLHETGIVPEHLITVAAAHGRDVLWAMEEALRCHAVGVVIGELRARDIDQVATRRLSLAAAAGNTFGLILRTAPDDTPSAAATRWIIGAAPSVPARRGERSGVGPPRLVAHLVRNRRGHLGAWIVEWNSVEQRFELATHPESVVGAASDRPHRAAVA
jgi:protein ImuA